VEHSNAHVVKLRTDELVWRQVGDEVLILDAASSQYLSVNETGSALWPLLLEGCQRADLAQSLVTRFGVDESRMGIVGLADKDPEAEDDTPEGRAKNRRVDVIIANRLAGVPKPDKAAPAAAKK